MATLLAQDDTAPDRLRAANPVSDENLPTMDVDAVMATATAGPENDPSRLRHPGRAFEGHA